MKILLATLAVCTLFTGCLPPPGSAVVVTPGYHRPYGYGYGHPYGYDRDRDYRDYRPGVPYRMHEEIVEVNRQAPAPRYEVVGRPPYPGARWSAGKWVWINNHWVWNGGHWARRY